MEVGGDKTDSKANRKNKPKPGTQVSRFTGAATSESVLYNTFVISGTNQDGQLITLVKILPNFIGINHYAGWAESFRSMKRNNEVDFIPTAVRKRDYGTVNTAGVLYWRSDALGTEEEYKRNYKILDRNVLAGIKQ